MPAMTGWQLAWVLGGVAVAVMLIVLLARAPRKPTPAIQAAGTSRRPISAGASADTGAPGPAEGTARPAETPELHNARMAAAQALQAVAFSAQLAPASGTGQPRRERAAIAESPSSAQGNADQESAASAIRETLLSIVERPNYAPRRPLLLPKLMQAMNDDDVSRRELALIIATDPALAGSLLRLANSPFYRLQPEPVESLDRAIALLGLEGMRSLISAALLQPVFRISGGMFLRFGEISWEHTLYAAGAAEAHAAVLENADPFAAQLLALIMGLAGIVVFRVANDEYLTRRLRPNASALGALIELEAPAVARRIAASWELSERIDTALAEQSLGTTVPASALGRSLQIGRFIGALTLLHAHGVMDEAQVTEALKCGGARAEAYSRIWSRLAAQAARAS
jgi:HD-like signal output (HDOD) protein